MSKSMLSMAVAVVLLMGCSGGGKAGAGDYKLKVSVNPANGGSITIDPNMESYNEWADVEVTATANKGYVFEGWSGDATDKSKSVTIKMSGSKNKKLTANFKTIPTFIKYVEVVEPFKNVYTKPDPRSDIIQQVRKGECIEVLSQGESLKDEGWYKVKVDGKEGYLEANTVLPVDTCGQPQR